MSKADSDNHSNQLNPNNDAYYQSRGYGGRDGFDDDDDGGSYGGGFSRHYSPPPPSNNQLILESISSAARAAFARRLEKEPSLDLCTHLRRTYPYFHYRDLGVNTAVIVQVVECEPDSVHADFIKNAARLWKEQRPDNDQFTVFKVDFVAS